MEVSKKKGLTLVHYKQIACPAANGLYFAKFVHIMDSEGNKIELWEPVDHAELFMQSIPEN